MKKCVKKIVQKFLNIFLVLITLVGQSGIIPAALALSPDIHYDIFESNDPSSSNLNNVITGTAKDDGKIVTDKSVKNIKDDEFKIELSALGQSYISSKIVDTGKLLDVVFVLDVSGSMKDNKRYIKMTNAVNTAMETISNSNINNRMGVVTFSNVSKDDDDEGETHHESANVLLTLDSYKTNATTNSKDPFPKKIFKRPQWPQYGSDSDTFLVASNNKISTSEKIRKADNSIISKKTVEVVGGTFTQAGIQKGAEMLINASNKKDRVPVLILLSDGEPTYYTTNYTNPSSGNKKGNGSEYSGEHGINTIKTAVHFKDQITKSYKTVNKDNYQSKFYTIALDLDGQFAKTVLDPSKANISALSSRGKEGELKSEINKLGKKDISYADKGYFGQMSEEDLKKIFDDIAKQLVSHESSPIDLMSSDVNHAVRFVDTLGTGMTVANEPKIMYAGLEYRPTSKKVTNNTTSYFYNYEVATLSGKLANLNELVVEVTKNTNNEEIVFAVSKDLFPYTIRNDKEVKQAKPIVLSYNVKLSDEAAREAKTGDVFYTNNWNDKKTYSKYAPATDNPYYDSNYVDKKVNKDENVTGTSNTRLETSFSNGKVTTILGNNGKLVLADPLEEINIPVVKEWDDDNNRDGIRPESIDVRLVKNNVATNQILTLNKDNEWKDEFVGLRKYTDGKEIKYTIEEISKIEGYTTTYSQDTFTITNKHDVSKINKSVEKRWNDKNNQDGKRPDYVVVELYANGVSTGQSIRLNEENKWKHVFTDLFEKEAGVPINYTIIEQAVGLGYKSNYVEENGTLVVINSRPVEKTVATAVKVWNDANNQDGLRNDDTKVEVELYKNGSATGQKAFLTKENQWRYSFQNLDKYSGGKLVNYSIKELSSFAGYTKSENGMTVTNTHIPAVRNITVEKKWNDKNNQDGIRPDEIVVTLKGNGTAIGSKTLNAANGWTETFDNLAVNKDGNKIEYTVEESNVANYTLTKNILVGDKFTIENSYTPEVVSHTVTKNWDDNKNQDGIRPESIKVGLYKGDTLFKTIELTSENEWKYTFSDLDKKENGEIIDYSIKELTKVPGYTTSYSDDTFTITNKHVTATKSINVVKNWLDENNIEGFRPNSINVELVNDENEVVQRATLTSLNGWKHTFENLPVKSNGEEINYSIKEVDVPKGYTVSYEKAENGDLIITNSRDVQRFNRTITKLWDDNNNQDNIRPDSVQVKLLANGNFHSQYTLTRDAKGNYAVTVSNLEKYKNGQEIKYSIEEISVPGYAASYNQDSLTVTNTHKTYTRDITINKRWVDNNNQDGIRSGNVIVYLMANGVKKSEVNLNNDNNWTSTVTGLEVNKNGKPINYTLVESNIPSGYVATYNYNNDKFEVVNTHIPEKTNVTLNKVWIDNDNQDGLRKDEVTIILKADGVEYGRYELTKEKGFKLNVDQLDKYANQKEIKYTIEEVAVDGYIPSYDQNNLTVTNTHDTYTTNKTVTKIWNDLENIEGFRPNSIEVELVDDNNNVVDTKKLSSRNEWTATFENLPVNKNGKKINYNVREKNVSNNYEVSYEKDENGNFIVTNSRDVVEVTKTLAKKWIDNNNQDGIRPDTVTVILKGNGNEINKYKLTKDNNYILEVSNLLKYKDGQEIKYTIEEVAVDGYTASYDQNNLTVTNTHDIYTRNIYINKQWLDNNNQDGIRPESVTIYLMANDEKVDEVVLNETNNWEASVRNLPVNKDGKEIVYTLVEANISEGYTAKYENIDGVYTVTNTHTPEKVEVAVNKVWNDADNIDGIRANEITVNLLRNGEPYKEIALNQLNNWKYLFTDLDKFANGEEIKYTVSEISNVFGYDTSYSEDTLTIVNNHTVLNITKEASVSNANPGDEITYTITVSNDGNVVANDVVVSDKLDTQVTYLKGDGKYNKDNHEVRFVIPKIKPNEKIQLTFTVYVNIDADDTKQVKNTAIIVETSEEEKNIPSNEVITEIDELSTGDTEKNPETSDNGYILYITLLVNMIFAGYVLKKRFN